MEEKYYEILRHYVNPNDCATVVKQLLSLHNVSKSLNEYMPLLLKKGQKVIVTQNKTSHCYKTGDILRIIKPHYKYKDTWYCKKGWFGTRQALEDQEFYIC
jgi:hypothetical protein